MSKADLHLLRVFEAVAETGGFSSAEVRLNVSASTISRQISSLENRLGLTLCQRGRSGFRLTDDGCSVLEAARKLFGAVNDFTGTIASAKGALSGQVSIASIENWVSDPRSALPGAFRALHDIAPNAEIEHFTYAPDEIELALFDGRIEIGIGVFHKHKPGLTYQFLYDDPVELYCGKAHPLFQAGQQYAFPKSLASAHLARRAYLSEESVAPATSHLKTVGISHQIEGVAMFVLSGSHIGYLPANFAEQWVARGEMQSIDPVKFGLKTSIELVTRRGPILTPLAQRLWQRIADAYP